MATIAFVYEALTELTEIRVLRIAPGKLDEEIQCSLIHLELDSDSSLNRPKGRDWRVPWPFCPLLSAIRRYLHGNDDSAQTPMLPRDPCVDMSSKNRPICSFQRYVALSYVWGDPADRLEIVVDGKIFPVTRNLYSALKRVREPDHELLLWVDAVCIDQSNVKERGSQVKLMKRIYRQAELVVGYVGEPGEGSDLLLPQMEAIVKVGHECAGLGFDYERIHGTPTFDSRNWSSGQALPASFCSPAMELEYYLPPPDDLSWRVWRRFFASPYFRRIWILQEFSLAKSLRLLYGGESICPAILYDCINFISYFSKNPGAFATGKLRHQYEVETNSTEVPDGQDCIVIMIMIRLSLDENEAFGHPKRMISLMEYGKTFKATDLRDKIYGLIGPASDGDFFTPCISYSEKCEEVFHTYAKLFIDKGDGIELLYQAATRESTVSLPSWVPVCFQIYPSARPESVCALSNKEATELEMPFGSHLSANLQD